MQGTRIEIILRSTDIVILGFYSDSGQTGVQEARWEGGGTKLSGEYTFYRKWNEIVN
jgi:hypothetical protein